MPTILYLHGFLSAPASTKARLTEAWLREHRPDLGFVCPFLSSYPEEAKTQLHNTVEQTKGAIYAIGSSLGGFWASYLLEQQLIEKAVLVNPAVSPHTRFTGRIHTPLKSYYSDDVYTLTEQDLDVLEACESAQIRSPEKYWLMLQTGDEVLDYRHALARYKGVDALVEEGGDHSFVDYERHIEAIVQFFGI